MDKKKNIVLKAENISEEIYEDIFEQYFDSEEEDIIGGEENEIESK
ncbi:hypothetical protein [Geotoga petraea]|jgi:hypothetical protein|uniref:Uncharacterized protein n=1 Tax=Geotoga petraea TaxID=28234 RepID=A0A1G6PN45_9BACT|nr:hypothetical protein [Geotoga petraea]MDK2946075.1 hypothetical protein [Geotoga sp.]SDC80777.1 hypothetical protein SAMN04488588_1846 [Geotoga petraea]